MGYAEEDDHDIQIQEFAMRNMRTFRDAARLSVFENETDQVITRNL